MLSTFASHHPLESRTHYFPERAGDRALIERALATLRAFVAELRQHLLRGVEADHASAAPEVAIEIETLGLWSRSR